MPEVTIPTKWQHFERRDPDRNISKFWAFRFVPATRGMGMRLAWGRISTKGQDKVLTYPTDEACLAEARRRTEEKLREGYRPVRSTDWRPPYFSEEDREPTTPFVGALAKAVDRAFVDGDGWKIENGRSVRPRSRRDTIPERTPDPLDSRDYFPPREIPKATGSLLDSIRRTAPPRPPRPPVVAQLAAPGRSIDFED